MLNIFDIVPEPTTTDVFEVAKSTPWIFAYAAIGVIILIAVLIVVKIIAKSGKKNK